MSDMELVLSTLGELDRKIDKLSRRMKTLNRGIETLDQSVVALDQSVVALDQKVVTLDQKVVTLDHRVEVIGLESRVRDGELSLKINALIDSVTDLRNEYRNHIHPE